MDDDLSRLRLEYADREFRLTGSDIYSPFNSANLFTRQQHQRDMVRMLRQWGCYPLSNRVIMELGCGRGGVLLEYLSYGVMADNLNGCDILFNSLMKAYARLPFLPLINADGQSLPYPAGVFDLVIQSTVFTSILDDTIRQNLAREMLRVLHPEGTIIWYDFWLNPTNPQTRGIRPFEIRKLFPNCAYKFKRVTLAPPIARRLVPVSWIFAALLEKIKIFNSHYLVIIQPQ